MSLRILRRAASLGAAVALAAVTAAAVTPTASAAPANPALPAGFAEALQRDLGMTPEQFDAAGARAAQLGALAAQLEASAPNVFSGAWMEGDRGVVAIADGAGADTARASAQAAGFDLVNRSTPVSALRALETQLAAWITTLPTDIQSLVGAFGVDTKTGTLALQLLDNPLTRGLVLPGNLGAARIVFAPQHTDSLQNLLPKPPAAPGTGPAIGGQSYIAHAPGAASGSVCSLGFNGELDGKAVNITAAHCGNVGDVVRQGPTKVGTFTQSHKAADVGIITADAGEQERRFDNASVIGRTGTTDIAGVTARNTLVVGTPVCKAGQTTGFSCGRITSTDTAAGPRRNRDQHKVFVANICALPGDSGGPIWSGRNATGISSMSDVAHLANLGPQVACALAQAGEPVFGVGLYGVHIDEALSTTGATVNTRA